MKNAYRFVTILLCCFAYFVKGAVDVFVYHNGAEHGGILGDFFAVFVVNAIFLVYIPALVLAIAMAVMEKNIKISMGFGVATVIVSVGVMLLGAIGNWIGMLEATKYNMSFLFNLVPWLLGIIHVIVCYQRMKKEK